MPLVPTMFESDGPRIAYDTTGEFAYIADEMLVLGDTAVVRLAHLAGSRADQWRIDDDAFNEHVWVRLMDDRVAREELIDAGEYPPDHTWVRVSGVDRPLALVRALRAEGHPVQPNHVFTADCFDWCGPHPVWMTAVMANPMTSNPMTSNQMTSNPMTSNPMTSNPMTSNPMTSNPMTSNPMTSNPKALNSAVPATGRAMPPRTLGGSGPHPRILVLDTGIAGERPPLLADANRFTGQRDEPDVALQDAAGVLRDADNYLDPVAGHGTFIAGIVEQLAPGCSIHVHRVLTPFGFAAEDEVADAIVAAADGALADYATVPDIINLSLGGPVMEHPFTLATAINGAIAKGIVVVASAGNSGTCRPQFPAALDGVVSVAALGPDGPAPWTNYGCWVDACAPGSDLVSAFFHHFDGDFPMRNTFDEDAFDDWARWSGTSFAAPVVVAAIAREMVMGRPSLASITGGGSVDAQTAVQRVLNAPHLVRLPGLGTVVNI